METKEYDTDHDSSSKELPIYKICSKVGNFRSEVFQEILTAIQHGAGFLEDEATGLESGDITS